MNIREKIQVFASLGNRIRNLSDEEFDQLAGKAYLGNRWFTDENIKRALSGIAYMLDLEKLASWTAKYELEQGKTLNVGVIMAGNIPLVGFHDLMCVLLSNHRAIVKMSSQDEPLTRWVIDQLKDISPEIGKKIEVKEKLSDIEAVIATGSDNSSRYFEYYFGKYANIIRKNRTSVALLTGSESKEELLALGEDVFSYFGMGCRNVSKLFVPAGYDFKPLLDIWQHYADVLDHYKYRNNYDYHKSILLVNREPHLDTGFSLLKETDQLVSPLSVTYYEHYQDLESAMKLLAISSEKIQCIVSNTLHSDHVAFGQAQSPEPWDYADGIDTLDFLFRLSQ